MADIHNATMYALAKHYSGSGNWLDESGGTAHDLTLGSAIVFRDVGESLAYWINADGDHNRELTCPYAAKFNITGDLTIWTYVTPPDWTPASDSLTPFSRWGSTVANQCFYLAIRTAGTITLNWHDGTSAQSATSSAHGFTDDTARWIGAELDVDNGGAYTVRFLDGGTHPGAPSIESVISTVNGGTTTSIRSNTSQGLEIGARNGGAIGGFKGKIHHVIVKSGLHSGGTDVVDWRAADYGFADLYGTHTDNQSNVWTPNRGSISGTDEPGRIIDQPLFFLDGGLSSTAFMEIADHTDFDLGASDHGTFMLAFRCLDTAGARIAGKKAGTGFGNDGWLSEYSFGNWRVNAHDSVGAFGDVGPAHNSDTYEHLTHGWVLDRTAADIHAFTDGTGSGSPGSDRGGIANAVRFLVGRIDDGGIGRAKIDVYAVFWVKGTALTDAEMSTLHSQLIGQLADESISATPVSCPASIPTPSFKETVTPATVSAPATLPAVTIQFGVAVAPTSVTASAAIPFSNRTAPSPVTGVAAIPTPADVGAPWPTYSVTLASSARSEYELGSV